MAGYSGHVILFKFKKQECLSDTLVLEIPITYENTDEADVSPECEFIPRSLPKQPDSIENEKKVSLELLCVFVLQLFYYLMNMSTFLSFFSLSPQSHVSFLSFFL